MMGLLFLVYTSVLLGIPVSGYDKTLRLVNLVYRHGDRSPVTTYPLNNVSNAVWPEGFGWLTVEGERMHYSLGRFLRRRYDGFLSPKYSHREIRVESSALERCLMSAYSNLAGLYEPSEEDKFNKDINWQPIPVETRPRPEDNMIALHRPCPKYHQVYNARLKSERVKKFEDENRELIDLASKKSGLDLNVDNFWKVSDTTLCQKRHNFTIPDWVTDAVFEQMMDIESFGMDMLYHEDVEKRLMGGPMLKQWILNANQNIAGKWSTRMQMYSGHDTTVTAVMSALGVFNRRSPPYTTTVFMELHFDTQYYVELYLRNVSSQKPNDTTQPHKLTLPGCEFKCPYKKFIELTAPMIPGDWESECAVQTEAEQEGMDYKRAFLITVCVYSVACFLLVVTILVLITRRRKSETWIKA